jgi:hypothetical protein
LPDASNAAPPAPERYEVDEVVAIAVDPTRIYLYWEVRPATLAHARKRQPDGRLAIRIFSVLGTWEGPITRTRDMPIDALQGDLYVRDVEPGANIRVSIGWLAATFEPFAVGVEISAPRALPLESADLPAIARWRRDANANASAAQEVSPGWRAVFAEAQRAELGDASTVGVSLTSTTEPGGVVVERRRIPIRGGASEVAWKDLEVRRYPLGGASELGARPGPRR